MDRGRVGEERGSKETDRYPLTDGSNDGDGGGGISEGTLVRK
jgi:hypothetical protein